jgi:superfamily II DNA or RNA helicase
MRTYGTIKLQENAWVIEAEAHVVIRLKRLFAKLGKSAKKLEIKHSQDVARDLLWAMERYPLEIDDADARFLRGQSDLHVERTERFVKVLSGERAPQEFQLAVPARDYQRVAADLALQSPGLLIADDVGTGKEQPVDALVLTPSGYRAIGGLKVGDMVIGSSGKPIAVTGVYPQGVKASYRFTMSDGSTVEAGDEHLWTVEYWSGGRTLKRLTLTTHQIRTGAVLEQSRPSGQKSRLNLARTKLYVPMLSGPVEFAAAQEPLPIEPYLLGQLIANGCLCQSSAQLTVAARDWDEVRSRLDPALVCSVRAGRGCLQVVISGVLPSIRAMGLDVKSAAKFIPERYVRGSVAERVALLHGLMDGDGSCSLIGNKVSYHTTSEQLSKDVQALVESLGGSATRYTRERICKPTEYPVKIRMPEGIEPFSISRKLGRYKPGKRRAPTRSISSVSYVRDVESVCIRVDAPDLLYVTEHAILTHNTCSVICVLTDPRTRPALIVTLTHLPKQWAKEISRFAPRLRTHILKKATPYPLPECDVIITNYHKLSGWAPALAGKVNLVAFDEVQELRSAGTQRYKAAEEIAHPCQWRIGASATPIHNYGNEFFNVLSILRPGELGTRAEFVTEWCGETDSRGNSKIKDPRAFGSYLREQGIMIRRTRGDVGRELPGLSVVPHTVESGDIFEQLDADTITELAKFILNRDNNKGLEQMQARSELDWQLRQATGLAKAKYVAEFVKMLLESGEERVLLYGWHHSVYETWREVLKDVGVVMFTGEESATQKEASKQAFLDGSARVLIMSLRAGAGLDGLQNCCRTVVFGELDWSPSVHEQATGRVFRDGQKDPVVAYYLTSDEGSDPVLQSALGVKRMQLEGVRNPSEFAAMESIKREGVLDLARAVLAKRKPVQTELGAEASS